MMTGYAYELVSRKSHWASCSSEHWDTVVYGVTGDEIPVGIRFIDGSRCKVFDCPDGNYRAQVYHGV
jgi:hypothetical protein